MSTYELGQTLTFVVQVTDDAGAAADLGGGDPACTLVKPDGTAGTATVTRKGLGLYWGSVVSSQVGRWRGTFTGTGTNAGKLPWTDVADAWPADPRLIISLADAKAALNFPTSVNDDEVRLYIASATLVIEDIIGPVLAATRTHSFDGARSSYVLPEVEVSGITSVVVSGVIMPSTSYVLDTYSGVVRPYLTRFIWGIQNVVITYTVGASTIPPNVILAARELVRHQYQIGQQGSAGRGRPQPDSDVFSPSGYAVPRRVIELLAPQTQTAT